MKPGGAVSGGSGRVEPGWCGATTCHYWSDPGLDTGLDTPLSPLLTVHHPAQPRLTHNTLGPGTETETEK